MTYIIGIVFEMFEFRFHYTRPARVVYTPIQSADGCSIRTYMDKICFTAKGGCV